MVDLKKYYCELPFTYTEIHNDKQTLCCPYWNDTNIKETDDYLVNWFSPKAEEVRKSMLNGEFKNCSCDFCPSLNTLVKEGKATGPIRHISEYKKENYNKPKRVKLCFDLACNLKCPTCRTALIPNTPERTKVSLEQFLKLENAYGDELEEIFTSGVGDPFYSAPMRDFLINITPDRYPKLKDIIIHTNGILWTPKVWGMMKNIHPYVHSCEISIDAATEESYEKIRLGGKWSTLLNNLSYINTIDTIDQVITSFVAQRDNYKEMVDFVELMNSIFVNKKNLIFFYKVANWGTFNEDEYNRIKIWDQSHPDYTDFEKEVQKLKKYDNVILNFN